MSDKNKQAVLDVIDKDMTLGELASRLTEKGYHAEHYYVASWVKKAVWDLVDDGKLEFDLNWYVRVKGNTSKDKK